MRLYLCLFILLIVGALPINAQELFDGVAEFDRTVHNFGEVHVSDGPLTCQFTLKNISSKAIAIYNVVTSCNCTEVDWEKEPLRPGQTSFISVTYANDEGLPFNKTINVYLSDVAKPVILRIKGTSHKAFQNIDRMFPVQFGDFGMKSSELQSGNLDMSKSWSNAVQVANLSDSPLNIEFTDLTDGLAVRLSQNPIPAKNTATMTYTVSSRSGVWGYNKYFASVTIDGTTYKDAFSVEAFTKENFSNLTKEEKALGSNPKFDSSKWSMGRVSAGAVVAADWEFSNIGKSEFEVYKVDVEAEKATCSPVPTLAPGAKGNISVTLDTTGMPVGEVSVVVTLTTNSPLKPVINLFITGWIE